MHKKANQEINIGLIGFGNMGKAIFRQLSSDQSHSRANLYICDPGASVKLNQCLSTIPEVIEKCRIILFGIKPQDFNTLPEFTIPKNTIIISIMAGISVARIKSKLPTNKIVRVMPNLPLQVSAGFSGYYFNPDAFTAAEKKLITRFLGLLGENVSLASEKQIDAITAVSGSGPAYVFLLMEAMFRSARRLGFDPVLARRMVVQTFLGSSAYAASKTDQPFTDLITMVRSKKGTTDAALQEIDEKKFYANWEKAVKKAYKRAGELSTAK